MGQWEPALFIGAISLLAIGTCISLRAAGVIRD